MSFVYNDKAWQIVEYKNLYYIELYTRSIRVYNQSFDQILKRDNPQYYYAQILVVEDTLFAMGKDTTFIDVLKIPSLELVKRIKWNEERYFVRSESTNMIYNKQEQLVYSGLYSDKKDTAVLTIIHINEDYREEVVWQLEHTYLLQILYNKRKKDYLLCYRKIYEENRREVFWEELAWLRSGKMFMRYEMEQDQDFWDYAFDRKEKIWFRGCFAPAWKSYLVKLEDSRKMDSFRKLTEINDLLAFSEDGKRCAYVIPGKTSKVYIYSLEKEACEREITLKDSELSWCEIQFVRNRYIAVRGCDYMFWYEI